MIKSKNFFSICFLILFFVSCHSSNNQPAPYSLKVDSVSDSRAEVKTAPVASYKEKTNNPLNDWYFSVNLYETKKRFDYIVKMQFEELTGEDTIHIPNFGTEPRLAIQKGSDKYSCIIGFYDRVNTFLPYKAVMVKNGKDLRLLTLHRYTLTATDSAP